MTNRDQFFFLTKMPCKSCGGARPNPYPVTNLRIRVGLKHIARESLTECFDFLVRQSSGLAAKSD
jgi:hypothetical protein